MSVLRKLRKKRTVFFLICVLGFFVVINIHNQKYSAQLDNHLRAHLRSSGSNLWKNSPGNKYGSRVNYTIPEVDELVNIFQSRYNNNSHNIDLALQFEESYSHFLKRLSAAKQRGVLLIKETGENAKSTSERFHRAVNQFYLYDLNDERLIEDLIRDLTYLPIVFADSPGSGNHFKVRLTFSDGSQGYFKPMRKPKEVEIDPDDYVFHDYERHVAEIAGFHLDRALGFQRVMPAVGRVLNMPRDLSTFLSDTSLVDYVYTSPAGNMCIVAKCYQLCGPHYPICGREIFMEGSISASLPRKYMLSIAHPYKRRASTQFKADWELDEGYCEKRVKNNTSLFRLLELVDLSVFDFLIGNMDRHTYHMFDELGENSFVFVFDNGRGFAKSNYDCMSCIAPLRQCCQIRLSTLAKLIKLYQGPDSLSQVMRKSLNSDPLSPVLVEPHLDALDRRLGKVIKVVSDCINNGRSWDDVVVDDMVKE